MTAISWIIWCRPYYGSLTEKAGSTQYEGGYTDYLEAKESAKGQSLEKRRPHMNGGTAYREKHVSAASAEEKRIRCRNLETEPAYRN